MNPGIFPDTDTQNVTARGYSSRLKLSLHFCSGSILSMKEDKTKETSARRKSEGDDNARIVDRIAGGN